MNQYVKEVLTKQCEIVGAKYEDIDFDDDLWFFQHEWTKEQEAEFIRWTTEYLMTNKEARAAIMQVPIRSKKICNKAANAFAFNFGWKYKKI